MKSSITFLWRGAGVICLAAGFSALLVVAMMADMIEERS